jgi:hypothetical protein
VSRVISEKCDAASRAAGKPATAPTAADTTGTSDMTSAIELKRCGAVTGSPPLARVRLPPVPATLPPPPCRKRTSGIRYWMASCSA